MTDAELRKALSYDEKTGEFRWLASHGRAKKGSIAGCIGLCNGRRYRLIGLHGDMYLAHRLAWLYKTGHWPDRDIDHADGNGLNNSWANLRLATRTENNANARLRKDNTTGHKGVVAGWGGRFLARIQVAGKNRHLGTFDTIEQAAEAYRKAAKEAFGDFANA